MGARATTTAIVVHGAWTPPHLDVDAAEIERWHRQRGFADIGYHAVIRRSGAIELGRDLHLEGAHVQGHNDDTLAVCLVGGKAALPARIEDPGAWDFNYTFEQVTALLGLCGTWAHDFREVRDIRGHRDFEGVGKNCPGFDVRALLGPVLEEIRHR